MRNHKQTRGIVAGFGPDRLLDQLDVSISTAEVASSRIMILGCHMMAHVRQSGCRWPCDSFAPSSLIGDDNENMLQVFLMLATSEDEVMVLFGIDCEGKTTDTPIPNIV